VRVEATKRIAVLNQAAGVPGTGLSFRRIGSEADRVGRYGCPRRARPATKR
jgi:hypothetical protein